MMESKVGEGDDEEKEEEKPRRGGQSSSSKLNKKNLVANKARAELNSILNSITGSENDGEADPMYVLCLKGKP